MRFGHVLVLGLALFSGASAAEPGATAACSGAPSDTQLTVQVTDLRNANGQVAITVYPDDSKRFLAPKGKLDRQRVTAVAPTTEVCFNLPGAGFYAVAIYHDEDADRDFDRTALGWPDEGFGFSNDAPTSVGLPSFEDVRFSVTAGANAILIHTRYP